MIVNGSSISTTAYPDNFEIKDLRQVEYTFPTYTIGEAASATILSHSDAEWKFVYKSLPSLADCAPSPDGWDNFGRPRQAPGKERAVQLRFRTEGRCLTPRASTFARS